MTFSSTLATPDLPVLAAFAVSAVVLSAEDLRTRLITRGRVLSCAALLLLAETSCIAPGSLAAGHSGPPLYGTDDALRSLRLGAEGTLLLALLSLASSGSLGLGDSWCAGLFALPIGFLTDSWEDSLLAGCLALLGASASAAAGFSLLFLRRLSRRKTAPVRQPGGRFLPSCRVTEDRTAQPPCLPRLPDGSPGIPFSPHLALGAGAALLLLAR